MVHTYVVVGAGVAGISACQALKEKDPDGKILLFTDEAYPFYSRMRLPEVISGKADPERLIIKDSNWFQEIGIEFHVQESVEEILVDPLRVRTQKAQYEADKVLLATGGLSFIPPLHGADTPGVFALRTMADALEIREMALGASNVIVLGGGLLGLELGYALIYRGLKVTVVEVFERLLPRQTDPQGARILMEKLEAMGFRFQLGIPPEAIETEGGKARALVLKDGRALEADLILVSAGVRPRIDLAKRLGLEVGKAIVVNDQMETSLKGVYGAGDCVEHRGIYYGIWPAAEAQGYIAGLNMAGVKASYQGTLISNQLKVVGIDLLAAGQIDPEGRMESEVISDPSVGIYRKAVYDGDLLVGLLLIGDLSGQRRLLKAMKECTPLGSLKGTILSNWNMLP